MPVVWETGLEIGGGGGQLAPSLVIDDQPLLMRGPTSVMEDRKMVDRKEKDDKGRERLEED